MRRTSAIVFLVVLAVSGCTHESAAPTPHERDSTITGTATRPRSRAPGARSTNRRSFVAVPGGAPVAKRPCVVALPPAWTALRNDSTLWNATERWVSGTPVAAGSSLRQAGVIAEIDRGSRSQFEVLGEKAKPLQLLGTIPRIHGGTLGGQAADAQGVALLYEYGAGDQLQNDWTLYLWRRDQNRLVTVAHNPSSPSGQALNGGFVQPILSGENMYWIQASISGSTHQLGSELMQYNMVTQKTYVVYKGLVTAAGIDGSRVLFSAAIQRSGDVKPPTRFKMLEATQSNRKLLPPPSGLTLGSTRPYAIVSNNNLIVWDTQAGGLQAWRPNWRATKTILPTLGTTERAKLAAAASVRDLGIYSHFLMWDVGSQGDYVMDLKSDTLARLTRHFGQVASSGHLLQAWQYDSAGTNKSAALNGEYTYTQYLIDLNDAPDLPACSHP